MPCPPTGDCDFKMELLRGNVALRGQFQKCVRRRAELSGALALMHFLPLLLQRHWHRL